MKSFMDYKIPEIFNQAEFLTDRHLREGRGEKIAIYYLDERITFKDVSERVNKVGNILRSLGIGAEDRILLVLFDTPELIYSYLGAMKIGAIPIPSSTLNSPKDISFLLSDSRAKALIINDNLYDEKIAPIRGSLSYLRHILIVGEERPDTLNLGHLMEKASKELKPEETSKDDMAFWMYTSGTTGVPKGVVHLHHDLLYFWPPVCEQVLEIKEEDVIFSTSKIFFSYGRNASVETPFLYGCSVILWPYWPKPEDILNVIEKYRPTIFFSVPSFYGALIRELEKGVKADFSSIRAFVTSGEHMPKNLFERFSEKTKKRIINAIGSTDVGGIYIANTDLKERPESSGRLLRGFEAKLIDEEKREVSSKEVGELWLKNDGITPFYWRRHEKNKEAFYGEWFRTGDLFVKDEEGYYYYQGRADDMLKISGQWVAPVEVENILSQHPSVLECAVAGVPFEDGLIKAKGFVVLREGYRPSKELEQELLEFLRGRIAHFKVPKGISFVSELPRTATGKLMRYKLRLT